MRPVTGLDRLGDRELALRWGPTARCILTGTSYTKAVLEQAFLVEDLLELGHDDPVGVSQLHGAHDAFLMRAQARAELFLGLGCQFAQFES